MILFADSEALREKRILVSVVTVPLGTVAGNANINLSWRQRGCVVLCFLIWNTEGRVVAEKGIGFARFGHHFSIFKVNRALTAVSDGQSNI